MSGRINIWDSATRYGAVSRAFHWLMVLMFLWQFSSAILHALAKGTGIYNLFWSAHFQLGFAILVLAVLRGVWGLLNLSRRPHEGGLNGKLAALGHLVIYGLMIAVPLIALIRNYANDRAFSFLGIEIFGQTGVKNPELASIGNWHGFLGWTLLVIVLGHIAMALLHHFAMRDDTLRRMAGPRSAA